MTIRMVLGAAFMALAGPAWAQAATPAAIEVPDPALLAAARTVVDLEEPLATREAAFSSSPAMVVAQVQRSFADNPQFQAEFSADPRVQPIVERYLAGLRAQVAESFKNGMPLVYHAMARSYARKLNLAQLRDLAAFLKSSSGQAYALAQQSILNDPDVIAARKAMYAKFDVAHDIQTLIIQLRALPPLPSKPSS